jgi:hypothetical protein
LLKTLTSTRPGTQPCCPPHQHYPQGSNEPPHAW